MGYWPWSKCIDQGDRAGSRERHLPLTTVSRIDLAQRIISPIHGVNETAYLVDWKYDKAELTCSFSIIIHLFSVLTVCFHLQLSQGPLSNETLRNWLSLHTI